MWSSLCVLSRNDCHHWREDQVYRMLLLTYCVCSNVEVIGVCGVEAETVDLHHAHHRVWTGMKWKVQTILWDKKRHWFSLCPLLYIRCADFQWGTLDQLHPPPRNKSKVRIWAMGIRMVDLHHYPDVEPATPICAIIIITSFMMMLQTLNNTVNLCAKYADWHNLNLPSLLLVSTVITMNHANMLMTWSWVLPELFCRRINYR